MKNKFVIIFLTILFASFGLSCEKDSIKSAKVNSSQGSVVSVLPDYSPCLSINEMDTGQLSNNILDFIIEQYPDANISISQQIGEGEFYLVRLDNEDQTELLFDSSGAILYQQSGNLTSNQLGAIPGGISDYISAEFSDNNVVDSCSFSDFGTLYINIGIEPGGSLLFDTQGNFLCEYNYDCEGNTIEEEEEEEGDDDLACPRQKGYWKTHSEVGPASLDSAWLEAPNASETPFFDTGFTYLEILQMSAGNNEYKKLAQQYVVAQLNMYAGVIFPSELDESWDQATTILSQYEINSEIDNEADEDVADDLWHVLKDFNHGEYTDC